MAESAATRREFLAAAVTVAGVAAVPGAGRLEKPLFAYVGTFSSPLKQLASVAAPEPQQLVIRPFDTSIIKDIEKGIVASELGLNPQSDGRIIRINIPPLSTDTRKKLVARIKELSEEAKISIRNVRRDANKAIETAEKDKTISEDQRDTSKEEVQELTKKYEEEVTELAKSRESDVMEQ